VFTDLGGVPNTCHSVSRVLDVLTFALAKCRPKPASGRLPHHWMSAFGTEVPSPDYGITFLMAEHLAAMALETGGGKDHARILQFVESGTPMSIACCLPPFT
jgi:hypothetical protein